MISEILKTKQYSEINKTKTRSKTHYIFGDLKIGVVLPAFNEEMTIGGTLARIPMNLSQRQEIIVVDDGSKDSTADIARAFGVKVIQFSKNRGNGAAVRAGILYCKKKKLDVVVTLDSDGQHRPEDIARFIFPVYKGVVDFIIGNRFAYSYKMPTFRKLFSSSMAVLYSILFGKKLKDPTNGFRAFSKKVIQEIELEADYSTIQEVLFKVVPKYRFIHIPTEVSQRSHGESFIRFGTYLKRTGICFVKHFLFPILKIDY